MKFAAILFAMLFVCGMAFADQTGSSWFHSHSYTDGDSYVDRYSEYEPERRWPMGVGAEITLWEMSILEVPMALAVDTTYDISNDEWACFGKVNINLSPMIKKLVGAE